MKTIRYLHRRTIDEARNDKAGPLAYRKTEATEDDLLRTRSLAEILDRAERDVLSRLEEMGHKPFTIGESLAFDGPGEPPEADPDNTAHVVGLGKRLAFAIRDTRRRLEDEGTTPELAGIMFTLGANVEAWRAMPFNKPAATRLRMECKGNVSATWEAACQVAAEEETRFIREGETPKYARGAALDCLGEQFPNPRPDRKTCTRRYSAWRKSHPGALPEKALR